MSNQLFEDLLAGKSTPLTDSQLSQFEIFCSAQNLSLDKWISISLLLFEQKKQHCLHFLTYISKNEFSKPNYRDFIHQDNKVRIYSNIFALLLTKATKQTTKSQIDRLVSEVDRSLIQCERIKMTSNDICRAFSEYYDGNLNKSANILNKVIENSEKNKTYDSNQNKFIAMLGLANIYFSKRNYAKALEQYKKVLSTYKNLPIKARIGMAYSFFYLEKYEMAKACFQRVLKLDSNCIEAYIGLAIIDEKDENYIGYFKNITLAAKINKKHPLVLIHLAQHYLIKGDLQRASKISEQGLIQVQTMTKFIVKPNKQAEIQPFRNDYTQLKARFNNVLGQIEHIKNNFSQALKYYRLASNQGLPFNQVYLTQVYSHPNCQNYVQGLQVLQKLFKQTPKTQIRFLNDSLKDLAYFKTKNPIKPGQQNKSYEDYYNQAIAYNKNDIQVKIELSNHIIETKKARSLRLLLSAHKTLQSQHSSQIKPQLLNNIGVLLLQNHEYQQAQKFLNLCIEKIKSISKSILRNENHQINTENGNTDHNESEQQLVKIDSNHLIALFNLAIVKQKLCLFQSANKLYQQIISKNKYFIDAHIRMAYVYFLKGDFKKALSVLQQASVNAEENHVNKFLRIDKILNAKAAILKLSGDHVTAKDVVRQLMKTAKDLYTQIYELSINYQNLMRKQPQMAVIKDFLRPNRQIYMRCCHEDPNNAFSYLVLVVLLLVDKRISLKQGNQLFIKLKQFSSQDIPNVLYNMGLFLINYDDYQSPKHIFRSYKQKTNDQRGEEMIALCQFLQGEYENATKTIKKNILLNPTNLKHRHQLIYTLQKKCQHQRTQDKSKIKQYYVNHLQILKKCQKFYNFFIKLNVNDYVKNYEQQDFKQIMRSYGQKIRSLSQQRKFYVSSNIDYYQKIYKDIEIMKQKEEEQKRLKNGRNNIHLEGENKQNQLNQGDRNTFFDQSDSEEIKKRKKQEKRRKALELARKKEQQINQKWIDIKQREKQEKQKKISRAARQPREKGVKKRQRRPKAQQSDNQIDYESQKSFIDQPDQSSPSQASLQDVNDQVDAPKRKRDKLSRKERRQRKKIKKQRESRRMDIGQDEQFSANPFDSEQYSAKSKRQGYESEQKSQKKKKKKEQKSEEQDDIGIDMNEYLL